MKKVALGCSGLVLVLLAAVGAYAIWFIWALTNPPGPFFWVAESGVLTCKNKSGPILDTKKCSGKPLPSNMSEKDKSITRQEMKKLGIDIP